MFASAGHTLKFHCFENNILNKLSAYDPRKPKLNITSVSWSHDNSYVALLQENGFPEIISTEDIGKLTLVHTVLDVNNTTALSFKNNTKRIIAMGSKMGQVVLYDTKNRCICKQLTSLPSAVKCMEFNINDKQLSALCNENLTIYYFYDTHNNTPREFKLPGGGTISSFHPKIANQIAVGCVNGSVVLWNTDNGDKLVCYQTHSSAISGLALSMNEKFLVTAALDHKICLIDNFTQECIFRTKLYQPITSIATSPDDLYLVAGLEDGTVYIYELNEQLNPLHFARIHHSPINKISFVREFHCGEFFEYKPKEVKTEENLNVICFQQDNQQIEEKSNEEKNKEMSMEENLKKEMSKMVKGYIDNLETQLAEHCAKFQGFVNAEIDSVHDAMSRWDVFNVEASDVLHGVNK